MSIARDIEARIDIVELASRYVSLKKSGANYKGLSPFKQEKSPSFIVSPAKNIAYCFATHRGGGPIKFLMEVESLEYGEALSLLAKEAGIELKNAYRDRPRDEGGDIYDLYRASKEYYRAALHRPENADKLQYVAGRGLGPDIIDRFELGYADSGKAHYEYLRKKGFTENFILASGIFSGPNRDKFTSRIVFPLANFTGHAVGFTGRIIGQGEPKYLNSPASEFFNKSAILYGLHLAKSAIAKRDRVVIVEGQMDTVSLHQAGHEYVVGISGSALTREQIMTLRRLTKNLYLCLDADSAGVSATFASIENMVNEDVNLSVVTLGTDAKDPDEFLKAGGDFEARVAAAESHIGFWIRHAGRRTNIETAVGKKTVVEEIAPMLRRVTNAVELDAYVREISRALDISGESVYDIVRKVREKPRYEAVDSRPVGFDLAEQLAGHLAAYDFFDLFSQSFAYTVDDLVQGEGATLLRRVLAAGASWASDDAVDTDRLGAIVVSIEEENERANAEAVRQKFLSLVARANKTVFESKRSRLLALMRDANNADPVQTMREYEWLLQEGKKLGIL